MILGIRVSGLRGLRGEFKFDRRNLISGKNGARKSSIKEAIVFAFTGQDSSGGRNPVHLISRGEDGLLVEIQTQRATISRTLTQKGHSTLKLIRGGVASSMSQTEFASLMCPPELFSSVAVPGYFMRLPANRKLAVLSAVLPKIDRYELWQELSGIALSPEQRIRYDLAKRVDLVAATIGADRREIQRKRDENIGKIEALKSIPAGLQEPRPTALAQQVNYWNDLRKDWARHDALMDAYQDDLAGYQRQRGQEQRVGSRVKEIQEDLSNIKYMDEPVWDPAFDAQLAELRAALKPPPAAPVLENLVDADNCPTCGQIVGLKHREKVKARNQELLAQRDAICQQIAENNGKIQAHIDRINAAHSQWVKDVTAIRQMNAKIAEREASLKAELKTLGSVAPLQEPQKPQPPKERYDHETAEASRREAEAYQRQLGEYQYMCRQRDQASGLIRDLEQQNQPLAERVGTLQRLEDTVKGVPQAELSRQADALAIPGFTLEVGDDIVMTSADGTPYPCMSSGEQLRADVRLSLKINQLMKNRVGVVFVDNIDLVDHIDIDDPAVQFFFAKVKPGESLGVTLL